MSEEVGGIAGIVLGLFVVGVIGIAFMGGNPNSLVPIFIPVFLIAVFLTLGVGLFRAAAS